MPPDAFSVPPSLFPSFGVKGFVFSRLDEPGGSRLVPWFKFDATLVPRFQPRSRSPTVSHPRVLVPATLACYS